MVRKTKGGGALGTALRKDKNKGNLKKQEYIKQHGAENLKEGEKGKQKLHSEVERDPVKDFLYSAELKQQKFEAVKQRKLVTTDSLGTQQVIDLSTGMVDGPSEEVKKEALRDMEHLRIPRRPAWDGKRAGRDQRLLENTVYLDWRRNLSALEEKYRFVHVTPYEKNIEIWRQLWIVIEKSDILVQIVDCRDPLFFRCLDLEHYVKEVGKNKINFLLLNKADLLGEEIRALWSDYLNKNNVKHIFFSAKDQQTKIDQDQVEQVPVDFSGILNTPQIADRGTLKQILKSIVNEFKQKQPHTEGEVQESLQAKLPPVVAREEEDMDAPKKSQTASVASTAQTQKAALTEPPKVVGPVATEPSAPSKPRLRIVREVNPSEIKNKPTVNLWSAVGQMVVDTIENPKFADDCSCDDCDEPEHNHETKEGKEPAASETKQAVPEKEDEEEDDDEGDEEGEEEEEEQDIYAKLGVDKNNLNSTPFYGKKNESEVVIGMIGFPNVGKSSVINVLCNKKLVGVGARPGKTKNFQTIFLEKELLLCDCPGLVFPSIVHSKTQMICNSVIPLDSVKDFVAPVEYICKRLPTRALEYILKCPMFSNEKYIEPARMLHVYATNRGIISGSGMPNYSEAAKVILKKFVNGELLYIHLPPADFLEKHPEEYKRFQHNPVPEEYVQTGPDSIVSELHKREYMEEEKQIENDMDDDYFQAPVDVEAILEALTQDEVMDLVMGKKVQGIKLDKAQKRELKFAIKRDADTDEIASILATFFGRNRKAGFMNVKKPGHKPSGL